MGANLGAFFKDDDAELWRDLLQPYGGGETGRSRPNHHDVEIHRLPVTHAGGGAA